MQSLEILVSAAAMKWSNGWFFIFAAAVDAFVLCWVSEKWRLRTLGEAVIVNACFMIPLIPIVAVFAKGALHDREMAEVFGSGHLAMVAAGFLTLALFEAFTELLLLRLFFRYRVAKARIALAYYVANTASALVLMQYTRNLYS